MKYALVKNGVVENVIVAEQEFVNQIASSWEHVGALDAPHEQGLGISTGWGWSEVSGFTPPPGPTEPPAPVPEPPVYSTYIDIGPFFDRFKELKILVLTHPDPTIKALITDIQIRKWIDLDLQEVQQALQYIGTVIPQLTSDRILEIITTPVADHENLALRKLYFNA